MVINFNNIEKLEWWDKKLTFKNFNLFNQTKLVEQNSTQLLHVKINLAIIKN